jgi:hypothetical protein
MMNHQDRPDMAMTFFWIMRSIPAMPIAESKPPMVVGSLISYFKNMGLDFFLRKNMGGTPNATVFLKQPLKWLRCPPGHR